MDAELILNDIRYQVITSANQSNIDVAYCEYDFETSQWNLGVRLEQTLPPNRYNNSQIKVVECVTNRVHAVVEHDLDDPETNSEEILRKLQNILAELNAVGTITLSHAKNNRIQHGG